MREPQAARPGGAHRPLLGGASSSRERSGFRRTVVPEGILISSLTSGGFDYSSPDDASSTGRIIDTVAVVDTLRELESVIFAESNG